MTEVENLKDAVDQFSLQMKVRLIDKWMEGYRGWDDIEQVTTEDLVKSMIKDLTSENPNEKAVDIANRAMMMFRREK